VSPDYLLSPREVDFGVIDGLSGQQASRIVRVLPEAAPDVEIQGVQSTSEFLRAEVLPKEADDPAVRVQVSLDASRLTDGGSFNGSVVIATNSTRLPKAKIPVRGQYEAPASVEPRAVVIGSDARGEVEEKLLLRTSQPARVQRVQCSGEGRVRVAFSDRVVAREHILHVYVAPCPEKPFDGELRLEVELGADGGKKAVRTLRVPVHRFSRKGVENG